MNVMIGKSLRLLKVSILELIANHYIPWQCMNHLPLAKNSIEHREYFRLPRSAPSR